MLNHFKHNSNTLYNKKELKIFFFIIMTFNIQENWLHLIIYFFPHTVNQKTFCLHSQVVFICWTGIGIKYNIEYIAYKY